MCFAHHLVIPGSKESDRGDFVPVVLSPVVRLRCKHEKFFALRSGDWLAKGFILARAFTANERRKADENNKKKRE